MKKIILITGGTRGIGKAVGDRLAENGDIVLVTSRQAKTFPDDAVAGKPTVLPLDVTSEKSVTEVFSWIENNLGKLDVLINNAGIGHFKPTSELSLLEWNEVIQTNLTGAFLCSREAFRLMATRGGGRMINIGSVADHIAISNCGAYGASKSALRTLGQVLNEEGKSKNIVITHLSLGAVATDIWKNREGFNTTDMLPLNEVATFISEIVHKPLQMRFDEVRLLPPKGVL